MLIPINVKSRPGIKRDGTRFEGEFYVDGQWVRFQRGLPRKIGGYKRITNYITGITRQIYAQARDNQVFIQAGHSNGVERFILDTLGNASSFQDRTPASYVASVNMMWQFDAIRDAASADTVLVAAATNTANDLTDATAYPVYYGNIYTGAQLQPLLDNFSTPVPNEPVLTSGGIMVLHPYLFILGADGSVRWSDVNDFQNFTTGDAGGAFITSDKLVRGLPLRGGGNNPAGLIWSLSSLMRVYYTGGNDVFAFDTISASSSIIAANSVIEYDGIYYWVGNGRFLLYNGVVREVENNMNINYFFDGLNEEYANKIFAYKVPRFGEIWWCYPRGEATECTHAVIYNVRENTWYDTQLPNGGRSAGVYAQPFHSPILAGNQQIAEPAPVTRITEVGDTRITEDGDVRVIDNGPTRYNMWRHEVGVDEISGTDIVAIPSYFETGDISMLTAEQPKNVAIRCSMIEPDFVQSGDMTVQMTGRINARAPEVPGPVKTFPANPQSPDQQQVFFKEQRREMRFRFESNTIGGDYQMGQVIAHIEIADGRYQS